MIFVVVGTQKFQMNRLLKEIDNCIEGRDITEKVFAQIGNSTYHPKNYEYSTFLCKEDFEERVKECNLLITHSGVATIITGLKFDKPVIVVPRLAKYGEHVDDHQLQIADSFQELNFVIKCQDVSKLSEAITEARSHKFDRYISQREKMIETVELFIDGLGE